MKITLPQIPEAFIVQNTAPGEYSVKLHKTFSHLWDVDIFFRAERERFYLESFAQSRTDRVASLETTVSALREFSDGGIGHDPESPCFCVYWIKDQNQFTKLLHIFFRDLWSCISQDVEEDELLRLRSRVAELELQLNQLMECTHVEIREVKP